jgi:hypothetical protein
MRFFVNFTLKPGMKVANFIRHMSTKPHLLSQIIMGHLTPTTTFHILNYMFKFSSDFFKADYFSLLFVNVVYLLL